MKRSAITLAVLAVIIGGVLVFGNRKTEAPTQTNAVQDQLANVPQLEPVSPSDFGGINLVTSHPDTLVIPKPDGPSKVGNKVDTKMYQGVVYKTSDTFFRVLFGKLADKSEGKLELADTYELVVQKQENGSNDVSLRKADPATTELDSNKIVRWSNLPDNNQFIAAMLQFKQNQQ